MENKESEKMLESLKNVYGFGNLRNNFESKCSMKVESNSRGFNTTVHVYEGCTKEQIDETVKATLYAHDKLQADLKMEKAKQDDLKGEVKTE
jgi:hypothetical protein